MKDFLWSFWVVLQLGIVFALCWGCLLANSGWLRWVK